MKATTLSRRTVRAFGVIAAGLIAGAVSAGPSLGNAPARLQPSPSESPTPTPSATPSPSSSPTASPTPSPSPTPAARGVSLTASDRKVTAGAQVRLYGQVVSSEASCEAQQSVEIRRRFVGAPRFRLIATAHTDSGGGFETRIDVTRSAEYRATLFRRSGCDTAASENVAVFVRVKVSASASDNPIPQGTFVVISGAVRPAHDGSRVILERKRAGGWRRVDGSQLNRDSRYSFTLVTGWEGERTFRVRWPSQDDDHQANSSPALTLRSI